MSDEKIKALEKQIANLEQEIFESNRIIAWLQQDNLEIERRVYSSTSWKMSAPLRWLKRVIMAVLRRLVNMRKKNK